MPVTPKAVRIVETGEILGSARIVAKHIDGAYGDVYQCLRGERHTHKGFTFEYVEEDDDEAS
jgi:hypothetical protein